MSKIYNQLFVLTAILLCGFLNSCNDQKSDQPGEKKNDQKNNSFETIEYAWFKVIKSKKEPKDSIFIGVYSIIDNKGLVKVFDDDDFNDTLTFHSYQLNKEQLDTISTVFDPQKKLDSNFITKKQPDSALYAGVYYFFSVSYQNGQKDSLCFVLHFMSAEFKDVHNMLETNAFRGKDAKYLSPFEVPRNFRERVLSNYKKSTYLPEVKTIPSFRVEKQ